MKLLQVVDYENNPIGLFKTDREDSNQVEKDILSAIEQAKDEEDDDPDIYVLDVVEEILELKGITRVYVDTIISTELL